MINLKKTSFMGTQKHRVHCPYTLLEKGWVSKYTICRWLRWLHWLCAQDTNLKTVVRAIYYTHKKAGSS